MRSSFRISPGKIAIMIFLSPFCLMRPECLGSRRVTYTLQLSPYLLQMNLTTATTSSCDSSFEAKLCEGVTLCRSVDHQKGNHTSVADSFQLVIIAQLTGTTETALPCSQKLATDVRRK